MNKQKKQFDVITIGGATEDITFYTDEGVLIDNKKDLLRQELLAFEFGAKIKIDKSYSSFGGGAANAAVCMSKLGLRVVSICSLGDDLRGRNILDNFKTSGVNTKYLQINKKTQSGFSFLLVGPGNEHIVFSDRASNGFLYVDKKTQSLLTQSSFVYLTSLSGKWLSALRGIFSVSDIKVMWNPGHVQLSAGYDKIKTFLKKTYILSLNKDEAIELVFSNSEYQKKSRQFLNKTKNLLEVIKSWGVDVAVITDGQNGADAYDGEIFYHQDIIKESKRIDTTGVGDAFGSTFLAGMKCYDGDIQKAMKLGVKNTSSVIGRQGAQNGLLVREMGC